MELLFSFLGVAIVLLLLFFSNERSLELLTDEITKTLVKIFNTALFTLFIYFLICLWLVWSLVAARRILVPSCGLFCRGTWSL